MSVDATLRYLNNLLDTSLFRADEGCGSGDPYITGHVFVDEASKKIWYSRAHRGLSNYFCDAAAGYFGAKASEIDPSSITIEGPMIALGCVQARAASKPGGSKQGKALECFQYWQISDEVSFSEADTDHGGGSWRTHELLTLNLKNAAFVSRWGQVVLVPKNDEDAMERFVRAFKHLVIAVRALPGGDPTDPFATDSGSHEGKEKSNPDKSLAWLTHHSWKSESEEHSDSQGCRTVDHRLTAITFSDDGQSLSLELFYYIAPTCSSKDVSTCRTDYKGKLERPPLSTSPPTIRFEAALEPIVAKCTSSKLRGETSLSGELEVRSVDEVRLHFSDESSGEWTTLKRVED